MSGIIVEIAVTSPQIILSDKLLGAFGNDFALRMDVLKHAYVRSDFGLSMEAQEVNDVRRGSNGAIFWRYFPVHFLVEWREAILFLEVLDFLCFFPAYVSVVVRQDCPKEVADEIIDMIVVRMIDQSGRTAISEWESWGCRKKAVTRRFFKFVAFSRGGDCMHLGRVKKWLLDE